MVMDLFIGITGGTCAGKTSVAQAVLKEIEGDSEVIIPLDNYYKDRSHLSFEERKQVNYDHPDAFDWELLKQHIAKLRQGEAIDMPLYDFTKHVRKDETQRIENPGTVILEGILALFDEELNDKMDIKIYVMTDADIRILRRLERDIDQRGRTVKGVINQYLDTVKPMHEEFIEPTKKHADIIIPEGLNSVAVELLKSKIES